MGHLTDASIDIERQSSFRMGVIAATRAGIWREIAMTPPQPLSGWERKERFFLGAADGTGLGGVLGPTLFPHPHHLPHSGAHIGRGSLAKMAAPAKKKQAPWKGFVAGSTGAMLSGAVTHPIDLVKVRMQLYGARDGFEATSKMASTAGGAAPAAPAAPGMLRTGYLVVKHEGTFGLYKGLSASLMRQASFIGTKFGAYDLLKTVMPKDADGGLSFVKMTMCGLGAGAIGAAVGNPADLAMVRMQADGRLPVELRRNYKHGGEVGNRKGGRGRGRRIFATTLAAHHFCITSPLFIKIYSLFFSSFAR